MLKVGDSTLFNKKTCYRGGGVPTDVSGTVYVPLVNLPKKGIGCILEPVSHYDLVVFRAAEHMLSWLYTYLYSCLNSLHTSLVKSFPRQKQKMLTHIFHHVWPGLDQGCTKNDEYRYTKTR